MSMKEIAKDQKTPLYGFHWSAGIGQPAVVLWLDGRCIIAGAGTRAEQYLADRGAIPVGMLHFGRDPAEGTVPRATVTPVSASRLVEAVSCDSN
jgi:hypothetical protein